MVEELSGKQWNSFSLLCLLPELVFSQGESQGSASKKVLCPSGIAVHPPGAQIYGFFIVFGWLLCYFYKEIKKNNTGQLKLDEDET